MKLCFISDTHNRLQEIINFIPECDYLIHCGDLTNFGTIPELERVNKDFETILNRGLVKNEIIFIAGNHDTLLEKEKYLSKKIFTNGTYLENQEYHLIDGTKIYGSPISPRFYNWAFMRNTNEIDYFWKLIPDATEILITHSPPKGILDLNNLNQNCGCPLLHKRINELKKLKLHCYGHIHESYGVTEVNNIKFVNGASQSRDGKINPPLLIEI